LGGGNEALARVQLGSHVAPTALGEALPAQAHQRLHGWPRVHDGTLTLATFVSSIRPIRREAARRLETGQPNGVPKTDGVS
jgi:hypothetical protein